MVPVVPAGAYDFLTVVTHETGHFLGLAHSGNTQATMYWQVSPQPKWDLTADDVARRFAAINERRTQSGGVAGGSLR